MCAINSDVNSHCLAYAITADGLITVTFTSVPCFFQKTWMLKSSLQDAKLPSTVNHDMKHSSFNLYNSTTNQSIH